MCGSTRSARSGSFWAETKGPAQGRSFEYRMKVKAYFAMTLTISSTLQE